VARRYFFKRSGSNSVTCAMHSARPPVTGRHYADARAYAELPHQGVKRRTARSRLWWAADADPGCLLLDHVPSAMKGWLRRLRGGVVGVVLAIDVDSPREREWLRGLRIVARACGCLAPLAPTTRLTLVRSARGRPRWVLQCARLASDRRYWNTGYGPAPCARAGDELK
jgi:hypothetical protein